MSVVLETRRVKFNKRRGVCKSWRPQSPLQNTTSVRKRPEKPSEFYDSRVSFVSALFPQEVDELPDREQQALIVVIDGLVKSAQVARAVSRRAMPKRISAKARG